MPYWLGILLVYQAGLCSGIVATSLTAFWLMGVQAQRNQNRAVVTAIQQRPQSQDIPSGDAFH